MKALIKLLVCIIIHLLIDSFIQFLRYLFGSYYRSYLEFKERETELNIIKSLAPGAQNLDCVPEYTRGNINETKQRNDKNVCSMAVAKVGKSWGAHEI